MRTPRHTFTALGLLIAAVLGGIFVVRFQARPPDAALRHESLRPVEPSVGSIYPGGPPAPSAEMESGLTEEVASDPFEVRPRVQPTIAFPRPVSEKPQPRPLPAPLTHEQTASPTAGQVAVPQVQTSPVPASRNARSARRAAAPGATPDSGGNQSAQVASNSPATLGVEASPSVEPVRPSNPVSTPAEFPPAPSAAPSAAATPQSHPVLTPPVPVALDPPRHPDVWRVVVEPPGLSAEVRTEGVTARVRLRLHVRDDGTVERVEIAISSGRADLDAAAASAAKAWRFLPARRDGVPIASIALIWVAFVVVP